MQFSTCSVKILQFIFKVGMCLVYFCFVTVLESR